MTGIAILLVYVMAFVLAAALAGLLRRGRIRRADFSSLKTVPSATKARSVPIASPPSPRSW
ncbi:hypothetical protein MBELCI_3657 [Limimaricola cinnabarinus LL-001]|uniref:Uncharacterized protein n=1 Tax=Limimaricola cinnabarinus LL-001 TaxID=1337093 RepID=U2Z820_9RHOB|nr:hypothetical protein MBELCI_3657 [Limimaricola cinnabarinus LL-001]